jgi:squalene synthase HpnC
MTTVAEAHSGKSARDENFPVASFLVSKPRRAPIHAFYRLVRAADDVADHPRLAPDEKIRLIDRLGDALCGGAPDPDAEPLRLALDELGLPPKHALDLLAAFRLDATKLRYESWDDLIGYCRLSAMPVGRFVLDVHGEDRNTWPASDALCAALQVINHLQDCADDYRKLNRVYLPQATLAAHGASIEMLGAQRSAPELLAAIGELARRADDLARKGGTLIPQIADTRLALEISAIHGLALRLASLLQRRDPLSERVHLGKLEFASVGGLAVLRAVVPALRRRRVRA